MVDPAMSPAPGALLQTLFARKGAASPATSRSSGLADALRPTPCPTTDVMGPARPHPHNSPLSFLIDRGRAAAHEVSPGTVACAASAVVDGGRRSVKKSVPAVAAAGQRPLRRPLTVRIPLEDFARLHALASGRRMTYQDVLESAVRRLLDADGAPST